MVVTDINNLKFSDMEEYIRATKERPLFVAANNYFGYINRGLYKDCETLFPDGSSSIVHTFATSYADAVESLHKWILDNEHQWLIDEKHISFTIYSIDGSIDERRDEVKMTKEYHLNTTKLRKYFRR